MGMTIDGDTIVVRTIYNFYEGIGKYNYFFAGWTDAVDSVNIVLKNGTLNAQSPRQQEFRVLWNDYNAIATLAGKGGKYMLISRAVSMIDAILLAKKWNNKHDIQLSLNAYPDFRNKSGLGGVKLSFYFK